MAQESLPVAAGSLQFVAESLGLFKVAAVRGIAAQSVCNRCTSLPTSLRNRCNRWLLFAGRCVIAAELLRNLAGIAADTAESLRNHN
jgi:hypothetical protein